MLLDARTAHGAPLDPPARQAGRRADAAPAPPPDDLPPELAFLLAQGVAPALLGRAAGIAEEAGVTGEAALFGLGFPDERYARLLARHLGTPYLRRPLPLAQDGFDREAAAAVGWAPLAPRPGRIGHVFAPGGSALRLLLKEHRFDDRETYGFAVTTRRRFEALLRRHDAPAFRERAACGLAGWDAALSARGGATATQRASALAGLAALALGAVAAPGPAWAVVSALLFAVFAAAVAQRLLVVAASGRRPAPRGLGRMRDRDLPVYTLIVPLFREARVLPRLVRALDALDYPVLCRKRNKRHRLRWHYRGAASIIPAAPSPS